MVKNLDKALDSTLDDLVQSKKGGGKGRKGKGKGRVNKVQGKFAKTVQQKKVAGNQQKAENNSGAAGKKGAADRIDMSLDDIMKSGRGKKGAGKKKVAAKAMPKKGAGVKKAVGKKLWGGAAKVWSGNQRRSEGKGKGKGNRADGKGKGKGKRTREDRSWGAKGWGKSASSRKGDWEWERGKGQGKGKDRWGGKGFKDYGRKGKGDWVRDDWEKAKGKGKGKGDSWGKGQRRDRDLDRGRDDRDHDRGDDSWGARRSVPVADDRWESAPLRSSSRREGLPGIRREPGSRAVAAVAPSRRPTDAGRATKRSFEDVMGSRDERMDRRTGAGSKKVKVTNIPRDLDMRDIKDAFEAEAGRVANIEMERGTAWITFGNPKDARKAVDTFDRGELNGKTISVTFDR